MSKERLHPVTPAPLSRREAGLVIINYIRSYEERLEKARQAAELIAKYRRIGAPAFDGGNLLDPEAAKAESSIVNSWLHAIQGIDSTIERRGSIIPVYLLEWHGPNRKDPTHHNWAAYPRDYWDDYQRQVWEAHTQSSAEPVPEPVDPLELGIDLAALHQKIWQSLQPGPVI